MLHPMIRETWMYWKGRDRGLIWYPVLAFTRRACGEPSKNRERNWSEVQDFNPGPPEHERELSLTRPRIWTSLSAVRNVIFKQASGFLSRAFSPLFDSRRKRVFLCLRVKKWAEAVSVAMRDGNWDVGVLCCCGINTVH
jgi:hypothetical protein